MLPLRLVVSDVPSHRALFVNNGFLINSQTSLSDALRALARAPQQVEEMKQRSLAFARQNLDYTELARRLAPPACTQAPPTMRPYQICSNCIMDTSDSGIVFDERGWCDYCNNYHRNILPNWHTDERGERRSWPWWSA